MPVFCFWDRQCLCDGQDWEKGFLHGLQNSDVIILLISTEVCKKKKKKKLFLNGPLDNAISGFNCTEITR